MLLTWNMANFATSLSLSNSGMFLSPSCHTFTDLGLKVETIFFFFPSGINPDFPAFQKQKKKKNFKQSSYSVDTYLYLVQ